MIGSLWSRCRRFALIETGLLITVWCSFIDSFWLLIFLIEKREVIGILAFTIARICVLSFFVINMLAIFVLICNRKVRWDLLWRLSRLGWCILLIGWRCNATFFGLNPLEIFITYTLMALIIIEYTISRIRVIVIIIIALSCLPLVGVARPIFMTYTIIIKRSGCRSYTTQAWIITTATLQNCVR